MMSATVMIEQEGLEWPHAKAASRILRSGTRMDRMISDLLDFTRARLGAGIPVVLADMDLETLCRQTIDEITAFSELDAYMDVPLKAYSTGMQLRLAFAIATAFQPDILLLDEQFAMGDAAFMAKAERRLAAFVDRAGIVVQASHSERLLRETCSRVILLDQGNMVMFDEADRVFARYHASMEGEAADAD